MHKHYVVSEYNLLSINKTVGILINNLLKKKKYIVIVEFNHKLANLISNQSPTEDSIREKLLTYIIIILFYFFNCIDTGSYVNIDVIVYWI